MHVTPISSPEVFEACEILFGPEIEVSREFIRYLQPEGLKSAYRKRAFETHPDHSHAFGKDSNRTSDLFIQVNLAYHKLRPLVTGRTHGKEEKQKRWCAQNPKRARTERPFSCLYDVARIPKRKLLLGQFLYYSGLISWQNLIKAIIWQQKHRPRIGEIALRWNMLSQEDVQSILDWKGLNEKFGERALLMGYLNRFELMALLGKQRKLKYPFGEYFVRHRILHSKEVEYMAKQNQIHNRTILSRKTRP